jgi:hypothetical protein
MQFKMIALQLLVKTAAWIFEGMPCSRNLWLAEIANRLASRWLIG